jgi:ABC-type uncharacterized transport system auxiliary subunit
MKTFIKKNIIALIAICLISGCVDIKSKYIATNIYTIPQQPTNTALFAEKSVNKNIYIKQFTIGDELATSKIVVMEGNKLHYYNYNQWALPLDELLVDFTIYRFSSYNVFGKGIVSSMFSASPDYILDCKINKCDIVNQDKQSYLDINISASLLIYNNTSKDYQVHFSNNYTKKEIIGNFTLEKASIHLGKIMSDITDNILLDIVNVK